MKMSPAVYTLLLLLLPFMGVAQAPPVQWATCYGGPSFEQFRDIRQTADHGFIGVGTDAYTNQVYVAKTAANGTLQWEKTFGGSYAQMAYGVIQLSDGGYAVAANTYSNDGDVTFNHGNSDIWLLRLDAVGNLLWQKTYGGSEYEFGYSLVQAIDGGFVIAGSGYSADGDMTETFGENDYWIIKTDASGNLLWETTLGGSLTDYGPIAIAALTDSTYIINGYAMSADMDITDNHGEYDFWVVKLSDSGVKLWAKSYGGSMQDIGSAVTPTPDGGFILGGSTFSNDMDVSFNHGHFDLWLIKNDSDGNIEWEKTYGGSYLEEPANRVVCTSDGGYIFGGSSYSSDGDLSAHYGYSDFWIFKTNATGTLVWQKTLGGSDVDDVFSLTGTDDGYAAIAGCTVSPDGDVTGLHFNSYDGWIVKLGSPDGVEEMASAGQVEVYPNPLTTHAVVRLTGLHGRAGFVLTDACGREVKRVTLEKEVTVFERDQLQAGVYFWQIKDAGNNLLHSGKLVIQ